MKGHAGYRSFSHQLHRFQTFKIHFFDGSYIGWIEGRQYIALYYQFAHNWPMKKKQRIKCARIVICRVVCLVCLSVRLSICWKEGGGHVTDGVWLALIVRRLAYCCLSKGTHTQTYTLEAGQWHWPWWCSRLLRMRYSSTLAIPAFIYCAIDNHLEAFGAGSSSSISNSLDNYQLPLWQ